MAYEARSKDYSVGAIDYTDEEGPLFFRSRSGLDELANEQPEIDIILKTAELFRPGTMFTVVGIFEPPSMMIVESSTEIKPWDSRLFRRWYKVLVSGNAEIRFLPEGSTKEPLEPVEQMARELELDFYLVEAKRNLKARTR